MSLLIGRAFAPNIIEKRQVYKMKKRRIIQGGIVAAALCIAVVLGRSGVNSDMKEEPETVEEQTESTEKEEDGLSQEQQEMLEKISKTYDVEEQKEIASRLEEKKKSQDYTINNMLIEQNPFGTNHQSLYVYFNTDEPVNVSYTIHVKDSSVSDFAQNVYQTEKYQTEHEFQIIGLVPDMENQITFFLTREDGSTDTKEIVFQMGDTLGTEEVKLEQEVEGNVEDLEEGLYVVLGNDSEKLNFMYYYDNNGVLRGEVPLQGYRSCRLIFDQDFMYYSISETKMAQVNRLGQVTQVYELGNYELHHDYVFDDNGNMLILATDKTQDSVEDIVIKLDVNSGTVTEILDLGDLFGSYKAECQKNSDDELDWMHINTIQWIGNGSILLSSRETSSIIKIDNVYDSPTVSYIIGEKSVWADTEYESLVFQKNGDFTIQGGQNSITYVKDESLSDGQYYVYLFHNNIEVNETSYYYKYLIDENVATFELIDSFEVPYSDCGSSVQNLDENTVIDSGMQGVFGEYDKSHELIASFQMNVETFVYRVYKYDFEGYYFAGSQKE